MKIYSRTCALIFVFSLSLPLAAGGAPRKLALNDALALALENNRTLLAAREKVKKADASIDQTRATAFPELKANADYTRMEEREMLGTGGESFPLNRENNYRLGLTLTQKLYAPEVFEAIKASKSYAGQAEVEFHMVKARVLGDVKKGWYRVLFTRQMIGVSEEGLRQLTRHVEDVRTRKEVGLATDFDLLRAEVQRANAVPALTRARNGESLAVNDLRSLLGLEASAEFIAEGDLSYLPFETTLDEALEKARTARPEVRYFDYLIKNLEHLVKVSRKESYPSLDLTGNYAYANDGFGPGGSEEWETSWSVGLNLKVTLFDGFWNHYRITGQQTDVSTARIEKREHLSNIDREVRTAYGNLTEARDLILSQEKNVENAGRAFEIAEAGNLSGVVTELELLDSQLALTEAKSNYTRAVFDWLVAKTDLEYAMGTILEGEKN